MIQNSVWQLMLQSARFFGKERTHSTKRGSIVKSFVLIGILVATFPTFVAADNSNRKYEVGIRSAVIMGTMKLSKLDPAFADLGNDGLVGPHISGFFFHYKLRPHLRIGIETLVANSDQDAATTMNYQAAGPIVGLSYGNSWSIAGGVHAGGLVVNAMARPGAAPTAGATSGSFFKGNGGFFAPYVDIGYQFHRSELGVFVKPVMIFGESDRGGLSGFSAWFGGVRYALGL